MAINAYTGLPRSGKSYGVVENVIVPALKKGRVVWTNIPMHETAVAELCGLLPVQFHIDDIRKNPNWFQEVLPKGVVLVLDEAWRLWPSGLKANQILEQHKSFLAEHGHMVGEDNYSTEIYLVTQDLAQIAVFARNLVDTTVRSSKLTSIGQSNRFKIEIFDGPVTGPKPQKDKKIRQSISKYDPKVYSLYRSHTMSETGAAGDETPTDQRKNIFKGAGFKSIAIAAVLVPIVVIAAFMKVKEFYTHPDPKHEIKTTAQASPQLQPQKPKEKLFLDDASLTIAMSLNDGKKTTFTIRVTKGTQYSILDETSLKALGYNIFAVNDCLAMLVGHGGRKYVQCTSEQPKQKEGLNLVESLTNQAKDDRPATL